MATKTTQSTKKRALAAARQLIARPTSKALQAGPAAPVEITPVQVAPVQVAPAAVEAPAIPPAEIGAVIEAAIVSPAATAEVVEAPVVAPIAPLIAALQDVNADVARDAATALGNTGDAGAVEPLIAVIANVDGYYHSVVRAAAAASLGQIGDRRAVEPLMDLVNDWAAEASVEAVRALAQLGDARAVARLQSVVEDYSGYYAPIVRAAAEQAVTRLTAA